MIFWRIFIIFLKIGAFNFGGGYAMIALIHNEVVERQGWLTQQEFIDVVAISQATPGPLGINVATYAGYTAVTNAGYAPAMGILGAVLASFSVVLIPMLLMVLVSKLLQRHSHSPIVKTVLRVLRLVVVGLIASAALVLVSPENFGSHQNAPMQLVVSVIIFVVVFVAARKRVNPITLLGLSGLTGLLIYIW